MEKRMERDLNVERQSQPRRRRSEGSPELYPRTFEQTCFRVLQKPLERFLRTSIPERKRGLQVIQNLLANVLS